MKVLSTIPAMALVPLKKKIKNPTPTLAQLLNWAGWPVTASTFNHWLPPVGVILRKKKKKAVPVSQHPERVSTP